MDRLRRSLRESFRRRSLKDRSKTPTSSADSSLKPQLWQQDEISVRDGTCNFNVKYLGCVEVFESRGMKVCEEALKILRGERLSHAVGCAFAVCLERKQNRDHQSQCSPAPPPSSDDSPSSSGVRKHLSLSERLRDPQNAGICGKIAQFNNGKFSINSPSPLSAPDLSVGLTTFRRRYSLRNGSSSPSIENKHNISTTPISEASETNDLYSSVDSDDHPQQTSGLTDHPQQTSGFTDHPQQTSGFTDHPQQTSGFTDHPQQTLGLTDHPQQTLGFTDHRRQTLGSIDHRQQILGSTDHRQQTFERFPPGATTSWDQSFQDDDHDAPSPACHPSFCRSFTPKRRRSKADEWLEKTLRSSMILRQNSSPASNSSNDTSFEHLPSNGVLSETAPLNHLPLGPPPSAPPPPLPERDIFDQPIFTSHTVVPSSESNGRFSDPFEDRWNALQNANINPFNLESAEVNI